MRRATAVGALVLALAGSAAGSPAGQRTLSFSGYTWEVKSSSGRVGPGPNYFSKSKQNVWVDGQGRLHLTIRKVNGRWQCAEVVNTRSLGYGTYTFTLGSRADSLDKNVVLGLFTWSDDPAFANRELDVELARWGDAGDPTNGGWTVQPYDQPGHGQRFTQAGVAHSTHTFTWTPSSVVFGGSSTSPTSWTFSAAGVPQAGGEQPRLNLWLFRGRAPSNGAAVEVIVESFVFAP